jgi:hypothetical protein
MSQISNTPESVGIDAGASREPATSVRPQALAAVRRELRRSRRLADREGRPAPRLQEQLPRVDTRPTSRRHSVAGTFERLSARHVDEGVRQE